MPHPNPAHFDSHSVSMRFWRRPSASYAKPYDSDSSQERRDPSTKARAAPAVARSNTEPPHSFVSRECLHVRRSTAQHLRRHIKSPGLKHVDVDAKGCYLVFQKLRAWPRARQRSLQEAQRERAFNKYTWNMDCHSKGSPQPPTTADVGTAATIPQGLQNGDEWSPVAVRKMPTVKASEERDATPGGIDAQGRNGSGVCSTPPASPTREQREGKRRTCDR